MRSPFRETSFAAIAIVAVTSLMLAFGPLAEIALAQPAKMPGAGAGAPSWPVTITKDLTKITETAYDNILTELTRAGVLALTNALQLFLGQIAYDAANYVATGGKGQSTLLHTKTFGKYLNQVGQDAMGEFVGALSSDKFFKTLGFDLCKPDIKNLLKIQISLGDLFAEGKFQRPKPRCKFKDITNNWSQLASTLDTKDALKAVNLQFNTNANDFGVAVSIFNMSVLKRTEKVSEAAEDRKEGGGFKNVTDFVAGRIKTPASVVAEQTKEEFVRNPKLKDQNLTLTMLSNAWKVGPIQLASYTASIFVNTLASKMLKRVMEKGINAFDFSDLEPKQQQALLGQQSVPSFGKTDARNVNVDLKTPRLQTQASIELISDLGACPPRNRGLWNCAADQSLVQAVQTRGEEGGITINEALRNNMLHRDWKLIPDEMWRENQDPVCYTYAYCAGNMRKLRLARILPVGFEFAANSAANVSRCRTAGGCATLGEAVEGFFKCNNEGRLDDNHPWCHLIDSNWVITSPPQQCAIQGYGDQLMVESTGQRSQECQDVQTCLRRNDRGECVGGYGYCMSEKTVYRFEAQECPARVASCRNYGTRGGDVVSLLRNSLEYGRCGQNNVGCMWYATERSAAGDGSGWAATISTGKQMYFDKTLESCSATQDQCTKVFQARTGVSALNLTINSSFERTDEITPTHYAAWDAGEITFATPAVAVGTASYHGNTSAELPASGSRAWRQRMEIAPARMMTVSFYARAKDAGAARVLAAVEQFSDTEGSAAVPLTGMTQDYRSPTCAHSVAPGVGLEQTTGLSLEWSRFECTFFSARTAKSATVVLGGSNALVDALQLEESEFATAYVDGRNGDLHEMILKIPRDEYACAGDATDHPACARYAKVCRQNEAGCGGYTDTGGGPEVPAVLSQNDLCPASCVGYAEFRKRASSFDLVRDPDLDFNDPSEPLTVPFVPSTAELCTQDEVGCAEFTNVEAGASGEQRAYFSSVRACQKPGSDSTTYFTWEGSDETGFQLRTWSLKRGSSPGIADARGPFVQRKIGPDQTTAKTPTDCNEALWRSGLDPDCRQFYDAAGNIFYRFYSQTVLSTSDCTTYRLNGSNQNDCEKTGGRFQTTTGECFYETFVPESRTCNSTAAACRAFAGPGAGNVQTVFTERFQNGRGTFATGVSSNEALLVGDASLRVNPTDSTRVRTWVSVSTTSQGLYRVSFWAKAPGARNLPVVVSTVGVGRAAAPMITVGTVMLTSEWQRYSVGLWTGAAGGDTTAVQWDATPLTATSPIYLDEVRVERVQDIVYAKNNSWNTPAECDRSPAGTPQPLAMLGCRTYRDRNNQTANVRQFTRLCREAAIGCSAFVDTRNNDAVGPVSYMVDDVDRVTVTTTRPADRYVYLIDEPSKRCTSDAAGCRAFGMPVYSPDRSRVDRFETVFVKDDITKYAEALCRPSEVFCEEFSYGEAKEYFKDPKNHVCEYRENVPIARNTVAGMAPGTFISEGTYEGWFVRDASTPTPCYTRALESGRTFNLLRTGDTGYAGYGGVCAPENGECTEFRDANDRNDPLHRAGKPYFFVNDDKIDKTSCSGQVDLGKGCVLLRDMSDTIVKYQTRASYEAYQRNNNNPTAPANCDRNPPDAGCPAAEIRNTCEGQLRYCADPECQRLLSVTAPERNTYSMDYIRSQWAPYPALASLTQCRTDADCNDERPRLASAPLFGVPYAGNYFQRVNATCRSGNDANLVVKVKLDRDCAQWLGCQSSETVFDAALGRYREICTNLAMCDKPSGQTGDIFCANYVNRSTRDTEPILTQGAFLDINRYASRKVGLGEKDYGGNAIPNAFQIADLSSIRVAAEGALNVPDAKTRLALDYRLAATAKLALSRTAAGSARAAVPLPNEARILCPPFLRESRSARSECTDATPDPIASRYPELYLCQHAASGVIGFYRQGDLSGQGKTPVCYLPVRPQGDATDFQKVAEKFSLPDPRTSATLSAAYPAPECRAQPEQDSPFPASYVTNWDLSKNPPKAVEKLRGYLGAETCEYGEDCSCAYKRTEFNGAVTRKFYNLYSNQILTGVCVGGPRDGESCIPDVIFRNPSSEKVTRTVDGRNAEVSRVIEGSRADTVCGPPEMGGRCAGLSKVQIVRGLFGQCLESDLSQTLGGEKNRYPCLTWNPTPSLFGDKDQYHYHPKAGYLPPENSGQYYCTSFTKEPGSVKLSEGYFKTPYAGGVTRLSYHDDWVSNAAHIGTEGNQAGASLDGGRPRGSQTGADCEDADDDQEGNGGHQSQDGFALRLVSTGRSRSTSYVETFYRINPETYANWAYGAPVAAGDPRREDKLWAAMMDTNVSYFSIKPFTNPNGMGRLCCGYQANWVDGITDLDCDEADSVKGKDKEWQNKFLASYNPTLARGSEKLFANAAGNPLEVDCVSAFTFRDAARNKSRCYLKTWETNYRAEGEQTFWGLFDGPTDTTVRRSLETINRAPQYSTCASDKPFFSIRAVFQTSADPVDRGGLTSERLTKDKIGGPWRFVGFWVTSCAGASNDMRFIYMNVEVNSADVCRELAEVRSSVTKQDAAFTDRVTKDSKFVVKGVGTQYDSRYAPFSSALNTGMAGTEPLFQNGGEVAGYSRLKPPTFLAAGVNSYFTGSPIPKNKWAYLSNLFGRVYRIYRYDDQAVTKNENACLAGPFKGKRCVPVEGCDPAVGRCASVQCSMNGTCDTTAVTQESMRDFKICNSLSGINAGLPCSSNPEICHAGPMVPDDREPDGYKPLLGACQMQGGWRKSVPDSRYYYAGAAGGGLRGTTPISSGLTKEQAASWGAFRCQVGSARQVRPSFDQDTFILLAGTSYCSEEREQSPDCPLVAFGKCNTTTHQCKSYYLRPSNTPQSIQDDVRSALAISGARTDMYGTPVEIQTNDRAACNTDRDCSFTIMHFWSQNKVKHRAGDPTAPTASNFAPIFTSRSLRASAPDLFTPLTYIGAGDPAVITDPSLVNSQDEMIAPPGVGGPSMSTDWRPDYATTGIPIDVGLREKVAVHHAELHRFPGTEPTGASYKIGECVRPSISSGSAASGRIGRCVGGVNEGLICMTGRTAGQPMSCEVPRDAATMLGMVGLPGIPVGADCGRVTGGDNAPVPACRTAIEQGRAVVTTSDDPDRDNNLCTHSAGYYPRLDICPDPNDEFCGLIAYKISGAGRDASVNPLGAAPLPTDVTLGHYTPSFLGFASTAVSPAHFSYISYYTPRPPMIAAPDVNRCSNAGQCQIARMDAFNFNGQAEGPISVTGGQHKSTVRFYGWGAHNQMPLRQLVVDWGDGFKQELPDAKLKNHKPYCSVTKECSDSVRGAGLTCQTDSDCPPGTGRCLDIGTCNKKPHVYCRSNADCSSQNPPTDTCNVRSLFGNTVDACEQNYFEFSHLYKCIGNASVGGGDAAHLCRNADGTDKLRCSRDPARVCTSTSPCAPGDACVAGLAPPGGCWDEQFQSCRYTPRVLMQDNWGWCTGECRSQVVAGGGLEDAPNDPVRHQYGGCYSGATLGADKPNVRQNSNMTRTIFGDVQNDEAVNQPRKNQCFLSHPRDDVVPDVMRPWIVYPGALYLRSTGELGGGR